jgi:hypothetical protein
VVAYRERRLVDRPRPLEVLAFARLVRLPAAVFRVDLRVAAAERLPPAERFAFPRLVVVPRRLAVVFRRPAAAFFVVERLLCLGGFSVVPVTASAMALAALETPSIAASMLVLAVSAIVPKTPSFSLSMPFTSFLCIRAVYPSCVPEAHTESRQASIAHDDKAVQSKGHRQDEHSAKGEFRA